MLMKQVDLFYMLREDYCYWNKNVNILLLLFIISSINIEIYSHKEAGYNWRNFVTIESLSSLKSFFILKSYLIYHKTVLLLYFDKLMSSFYNFIENKNYSTISNYFNYPSEKLVTVASWTYSNLYQAPARKIYLLNL